MSNMIQVDPVQFINEIIESLGTAIKDREYLEEENASIMLAYDIGTKEIISFHYQCGKVIRDDLVLIKKIEGDELDKYLK